MPMIKNQGQVGVSPLPVKDYTPGKQVASGQLVRDGAWLGQAIRTTLETPAPVPTGNEFDTYQGTGLVNESISATSIIWGQSYTPTKGWLSSGFFLGTIIGNSYTVYVERGGSLSEVLQIENATVNGDTFYPYRLIMPEGKEIKLAVVERQAEPLIVDTVASYNYISKSNKVPLAGEFTHSTSPYDVIRINVIDEDGTDRTSVISDLSVGDTVANGDIEWSIQSVIDEGDPSYYAFVVSPPALSAVTGIQDFTFSIAQLSLITYSVDNDYWLSNGDGQIKGFFGSDVGIGGVIENDNAYRINLVAVEAYISDDYAIMAYSPELGA